jgi:hypothetical protein
MTARWSGVCRDDGGNAWVEADLEVETSAGLLTTVFGGWSPEVLFQAGARDAIRRL